MENYEATLTPARAYLRPRAISEQKKGPGVYNLTVVISLIIPTTAMSDYGLYFEATEQILALEMPAC